MKSIIYKFSSGFFMTSQMTKRIENRISILYPATRYSVIKMTADYLIKIFLTAFIAGMLLMVFAEFSLYYAMIVFLVVYALAGSRVYSELDRLEMKLLMSLQKFLEDVKYRFRFDGMLEEALQDAIGMSEYLMSVHGEKIYVSLKDAHLKGIEDYEEAAPNDFFKTFYMMCRNVSVYGDKKINGESYFIRNLSYLKDDIGVEILKRQRINNAFMGLLGIIILPVFAIKPIEKWGISNIPELADLYDGLFGSLSTLFMGILSFVIYKMVLKLKYPYAKNSEKLIWIERLSDKGLFRKMSESIIGLNYKKAVALDERLKNIGFPYNILEFYVKRIVFSIMALLTALPVFISISWSALKKPFTIWVFAGAFVIAALVYAYQYFEVVFKEKLLLMKREDELVRFQTIILMLKETDRISIYEILGLMEKFSDSFKNVISEILYKIPFRGIQVFEDIKCKSGFLGFDRLMDNFRACDYMSISQAFGDVEKEREYYIAKHRQDNEFAVEERAMVAKVLSFIPLCAIIITKLIVPFVVKGMEQISIL